jgi:hypothetical protein
LRAGHLHAHRVAHAHDERDGHCLWHRIAHRVRVEHGLAFLDKHGLGIDNRLNEQDAHRLTHADGLHFELALAEGD